MVVTAVIVKYMDTKKDCPKYLWLRYISNVAYVQTLIFFSKTIDKRHFMIKKSGSRKRLTYNTPDFNFKDNTPSGFSTANTATCRNFIVKHADEKQINKRSDSTKE